MSDANINPAAISTIRLSRPFYATWWSALSRPTLDNYEAMLQDPNASAGTGFWWLFLAAFCGSLITIAGAAASSGLYSVFGVSSIEITTSFENATGEACASLICVVPFMAFGLLLQDATVRMYGGKGQYGKLVFLSAAYGAPLSIFFTSISAIPVIGLVISQAISIPYFLFSLYLTALTIRAVYRVGWGKSILTIATPFLLVFVGVVCTLTLFGPAIGQMFN